MEIYLDNSATTRVSDKVIEVMTEAMGIHYGNPSSLHKKGIEAEKYIKTAKEIISTRLKVKSKEIYFTSGGTESNNLALVGAAMANRRAGRHLVTTQIEHPSVLNVFQFLEEEGFEVTYLPVDENGIICLDTLEKSIRPDTILVSIMYVNNEIGSIQPFEKICRIIHEKNTDTLIHSDAVQAFGKFRILPQKEGIDLLSASAHKMHGPKGSGMLYVNEKVKIRPMFYGGGQQNGLRPGTENVAGIAGFGEAARLAYDHMEDHMIKIGQMKEYFMESLGGMEGVHLISKNNTCFAPHILSVGFEGIKSEVLLHALEENGVYVSSGSACNSRKKTASSTLKAIGAAREILDNALRFSLSHENSMEELDAAIEVLKRLLPMLRLYRKR